MEIVRHSAPSKLDQSPLGTMCKVFTGHGEEYELYIQYSASEEPRWEFMGKFDDTKINAQKVSEYKDLA